MGRQATPIITWMTWVWFIEFDVKSRCGWGIKHVLQSESCSFLRSRSDNVIILREIITF